MNNNERSEQRGKSDIIEWIFFDVGNVLFHDAQQSYFAYQFAYDRLRAQLPELTFAELLTRREALVRDGKDWILPKVVRQLLPEEEVQPLFDALREELLPHYDRFHIVNDGAVEVLEELRQTYRLGILANQPPECRASLERRGLLDYFDVVAISEELDLHKPNVQLFEWALRAAGCEGPQAVMIGDRKDNDVAPAQAAGMRTILVTWPPHPERNWQPDDPQAQAFLQSVDAVPLFPTGTERIQPDRVVSSLEEIPAAVGSMTVRSTP